MPLSTADAGALVNGAPAGERKLKVRLKIATFVKGYGDCQIGDVVDVSVPDYQYLVGYKFAEPVQ